MEEVKDSDMKLSQKNIINKKTKNEESRNSENVIINEIYHPGWHNTNNINNAKIIKLSSEDIKKDLLREDFVKYLKFTLEKFKNSSTYLSIDNLIATGALTVLANSTTGYDLTEDLEEKDKNTFGISIITFGIFVNSEIIEFISCIKEKNKFYTEFEKYIQELDGVNISEQNINKYIKKFIKNKLQYLQILIPTIVAIGLGILHENYVKNDAKFYLNILLCSIAVISLTITSRFTMSLNKFWTEKTKIKINKLKDYINENRENEIKEEFKIKEEENKNLKQESIYKDNRIFGMKAKKNDIEKNNLESRKEEIEKNNKQLNSHKEITNLIFIEKKSKLENNLKKVNFFQPENIEKVRKKIEKEGIKESKGKEKVNDENNLKF